MKIKSVEYKENAAIMTREEVMRKLDSKEEIVIGEILTIIYEDDSKKYVTDKDTIKKIEEVWATLSRNISSLVK